MNTITTKTSKLAILAVSLLGLAVTAQASLIFTGTDSVSGVVPDADPVGIKRTMEVSGLDAGSISDVQVSLTLAGGYNGDLYGYLSYNGQIAVLLNRVGVADDSAFGAGVGGMTVTFADDAPDIHWATGGSPESPLTGLYQPDGRDISPLSPGALFESTSPTLLLGGFNGMTTPNGNWTLFLADLSGGKEATLTDWTLDIIVTAIPEPATLLAGALLLLPFGASTLRMLRKNRAA